MNIEKLFIVLIIWSVTFVAYFQWLITNDIPALSSANRWDKSVMGCMLVIVLCATLVILVR